MAHLRGQRRQYAGQQGAQPEQRHIKQESFDAASSLFGNAGTGGDDFFASPAAQAQQNTPFQAVVEEPEQKYDPYADNDGQAAYGAQQEQPQYGAYASYDAQADVYADYDRSPVNGTIDLQPAPSFQNYNNTYSAPSANERRPYLYGDPQQNDYGTLQSDAAGYDQHATYGAPTEDPYTSQYAAYAPQTQNGIDEYGLSDDVVDDDDEYEKWVNSVSAAPSAPPVQAAQATTNGYGAQGLAEYAQTAATQPEVEDIQQQEHHAQQHYAQQYVQPQPEAAIQSQTYANGHGRAYAAPTSPSAAYDIGASADALLPPKKPTPPVLAIDTLQYTPAEQEAADALDEIEDEWGLGSPSDLAEETPKSAESGAQYAQRPMTPQQTAPKTPTILSPPPPPRMLTRQPPTPKSSANGFTSAPAQPKSPSIKSPPAFAPPPKSFKSPTAPAKASQIVAAAEPASSMAIAPQPKPVPTSMKSPPLRSLKSPPLVSAPIKLAAPVQQAAVNRPQAPMPPPSMPTVTSPKLQPEPAIDFGGDDDWGFDDEVAVPASATPEPALPIGEQSPKVPELRSQSTELQSEPVTTMAATGVPSKAPVEPVHDDLGEDGWPEVPEDLLQESVMPEAIADTLPVPTYQPVESEQVAVQAESVQESAEIPAEETDAHASTLPATIDDPYAAYSQPQTVASYAYDPYSPYDDRPAQQPLGAPDLHVSPSANAYEPDQYAPLEPAETEYTQQDYSSTDYTSQPGDVDQAPQHYTPEMDTTRAQLIEDPYAQAPSDVGRYAQEQYAREAHTIEPYQQDQYAQDPYAQDRYAQEAEGLGQYAEDPQGAQADHQAATLLVSEDTSNGYAQPCDPYAPASSLAQEQPVSTYEVYAAPKMEDSYTPSVEAYPPPNLPLHATAAPRELKREVASPPLRPSELPSKPARSSSDVFDPYALPRPKSRARAALRPNMFSPPTPSQSQPMPTSAVSQSAQIADHPTVEVAASMSLPENEPQVQPSPRAFEFQQQSEPYRADQLGRDERPPIPLACFAFGGKLVTWFPQSTASLSSAYGQPFNSTVQIRRIETVMPKAPISTFNGPLFMDGGSRANHTKKRKEVQQWLDTRVIELERQIESQATLVTGFDYGSSDATRTSERVRAIEEKLVMLRLVRIHLAHEGKISGLPAIDDAVRAVLLPASEQEGVENSLSLPIAAQLSHGRQATGESAIASYSIMPNDVQLLQKLLVHGKKQAALQHALDNRLWTHALLIASAMDKQTWQDAVTEFIKDELGPQSGGGKDTEALRVVYGLLSGAGGSAVHQIVPPRSLAFLTMMPSAPSQLSLPGMAISRAATPAFQRQADPDAVPAVPAETLDKWRSIAAGIVANRTAGDAQALIALGDLLVQNQRTMAGHCCYLLSPIANILGGPDMAGSRLRVLARHSSPSVEDSIETEGVILTEILEYVAALLPTPKGQEPYPGMAHLQSYRLWHAWQLTEVGNNSQALRYCEAITATLKQPSRAPIYYHAALITQLQDLSERLNATPQVDDKSGSWVTRKIQRPTLDSLWSNVGSGLTKFVAGEGDEGSASPVPAPQPPTPVQATASLPSVGPFSHYSSISPGVIPPVAFPSGASEPEDPMPAGRQFTRGHAHQRSISLNVTSTYGPTTYSAPSWATQHDPYAPSNLSHETTPRDSIDSYAPPTWGAHDPRAISTFETVQESNEDESNASLSRRDEDDEDLGFGNSKPRKPVNDTDEPQDGSAEPTSASISRSTSAGPRPGESTLKPSPSSSWLGRLFKRDGTSPGPIRAKLGEETSFVFDPVSKRWVNKKAGATESESAAMPPPPPRRSQTASPGASMRAAPPARFTTVSPPRSITEVASPVTSGPPPSLTRSMSALPTNPAVSSIKASEPPPLPSPRTSSAGNTPPPPPPSSRPGSVGKKKAVRARYVDVLAQQ
ncbi:uncharacterized protein L969DRAFT_53277 [Mixia osmundae IAM 14324]|uniref:Protein transport protein sec16 n=1 Tax=Mixia osmundae (strain CBS 9802 / IAM 14324 / JCM 22182 / KY 12970) TaxID=764103 RepID=G7DUY3_MIXOS|nr:uncharacterized protein L969DRAFT_53277 [Mixia osmundae IAM 14324]KEI37390.1 hypothetical protein L969DRAFT_53277 [Mixia osmundae IAM 14324]GAA94393.1 hypothetical protein E5Q_01044 [Mixia osmundae IAM 14324]